MCTLAIYLAVFDEYAAVIAANRDEYLDRPATVPTELCRHPQVIGGKDLIAGGTWLGVSEYGLVAGILNRHTPPATNPNLRSRGLLCLDALRCASLKEAADLVQDQDGARYNPFNLLVTSGTTAFVAQNRGDGIRLSWLAPGLHLLTNLDLDDFECPRISRSFSRFQAVAAQPRIARNQPLMRQRLVEILADHSTQLDPRSGLPNSLCIHRSGYGTRESSLIFVEKDRRIEHFFAPGPPCTTAFAPAAVPPLR